MTNESALARLRRGQVVFGVMQSIPSSMLTEIALWSGFDFVVLDCEHALIDEVSQLASIQLTTASSAFVMVRLRVKEFTAVGRYLDIGVDGILMPDIRTAEDAQAFVASATHGPKGTRSSTGGGARAQRYGIGHGAASRPLLIAMIESAQGVRSVDGILATEGIDGVVIGPHDLAADLSSASDFSSSAYLQAFESMEVAARRRGKILGTRTHPGFPLDRLLKAGHRFILASGDVGAIRDGFRLHLDAARGVR
jgi:2-keto-3-deoxy-L-rhamnonate aldolase RhmA